MAKGANWIGSFAVASDSIKISWYGVRKAGGTLSTPRTISSKTFGSPAPSKVLLIERREFFRRLSWMLYYNDFINLMQGYIDTFYLKVFQNDGKFSSHWKWILDINIQRHWWISIYWSLHLKYFLGNRIFNIRNQVKHQN